MTGVRRRGGRSERLLDDELAFHIWNVRPAVELVGPGTGREADSLRAVGREVQVDPELIDREGVTDVVVVGDVHRNLPFGSVHSRRMEFDVFRDNGDVAGTRRLA